MKNPSRNVGLVPFILFLAAFLVYVGVIFKYDVGVFSNNDLMYYYFHTGTWQQYGYAYRFNPLVFFDLTFLYGITHNFIVINLYNIGLNLLLFFLVYRLFDMFSAARRFIILAVLILFPAYFSTWSIIFTEKQSIIFVLASFLCLKNWVKSKNILWIFGFFIWMNVACYMKETNVVFYFFMLFGLFLRVMWKGDFVLSSFVRPLKTIKAMPLEFLIGLSILVFVVQYIIVLNGVRTNPYLNEGRYGEIGTVIKLYWFEFVIMGCCLVSFIKSFTKNPWANLLCFSGLATVLYITAYLHLIPINELEGRTYYIALPIFFVLICWLGHLQSKTSFYIVSMSIVVGSLIQDYKIVQRCESRATQELAEFIGKTDNRGIVFGKSLNYERISLFWSVSWVKAFKQSFPGKNIYFKYFGDFKPKYESIHNYALVNKGSIQPQDYYIVLKKRNGKRSNFIEDMQVLAKYEKENIFENDFYLVYLILGKSNADAGEKI